MRHISISLDDTPKDNAPAKVLPEDTLLRIQERIAQAILDTVEAEKSLSDADKAALLGGINPEKKIRVKTSVGDDEITNHIDVTALGINAATLKTILERALSSHPLFKNIVDIPNAIENTQILADMKMLRSQGVAIPEHFDNFFKREDSDARAFDIASTSASTSVRSWSELSADQQTVLNQIIAGSDEVAFKQLLANNILAKLRATNTFKEGDDAAITEATNKLSISSKSGTFGGTYFTLQSPEQLLHEKNLKENKAEQNVDEAALLASNPLNRLAETDIKKVLAATMFQMLKQAKDVTLPNDHIVKPETIFPEIAGKVDMQRALSDIFIEAKRQKPELAAKMDEILAHDLFSEAQRKVKIEDKTAKDAPEEPGKPYLSISLDEKHHNDILTRDLHITIPARNYGQFLTNAEHLAGIKEVVPHGAHCGDNCDHTKAAHNDNGSPAPASAPIADEAAKTLPQPAVLQTPATQPQPAADNLNIATANDNALPTPLIGAPATHIEKAAPTQQKAVG